MDEYDDPLWIRVLAFALAAAVAAFGSVGLFLAILGWYRLWLVLVVGSVVFAGLCLLARPLLPSRGEVSRAAHVTAVLAVAAISLITIWNASNASQQVLIIRDGGTYLNAGKWIASNGTLEVKPFVGPFAAKPGLVASSAGMNRQGNHLDFTLEHMFPALLAEAQGIGGDGLMFAATAILGGIALLGFYLLARRVLRNPIAALGATLCLGLLMPQVAFSRDSTTEISMQVLLFSAVWLLCDRRTFRHRGTALTAGLFVGLLQPIHIDGLAFIMGLPFVALLAWLQTERAERRRVAWALLFAGVGVAIGVALGWFDLVRSSPHYLLTLRLNVRRLSLATLLAIAVAVGLAFLGGARSARAERLRAGWRRMHAPVGTAASLVVLVGGFAAWLVRPRLQTTRLGYNDTVAYVQRSTHLVFDPTRRYFEYAVTWASWYIGPITLTLAIVGAAYASRAFIRGTLPTPSCVTALMLGPSALLYLWRPSITPDQIWATRRFVPAVFPVLVLAAFGVLYLLAERQLFLPRFGTIKARRAIAVVLGALAIAFPVYAIRDVSRMTEQRGFPAAVAEVCRIVGRNGAIVVPQERQKTWLYDPQTLRSFCHVPVAIMVSGLGTPLAPHLPPGRLDASALRTLSRQWADQKRQLFIVAGDGFTVKSLFPGARMQIVPVVRNTHVLDQTLVSRPGAYHEERLTFAVAHVPTEPKPAR